MYEQPQLSALPRKPLEPPDQLAKSVTGRLLILGPTPLEPFQIWSARTSSLASAVEAFRSNLLAAITVGSLPYNLITNSVHDRHFDRFYSAECIRGLKDVEPNAGLSPAQKQEAHSRARERFSSENAQKILLEDIWRR